MTIPSGFFLGVGLFIVGIGLLLNEIVVARYLSPDGIIEAPSNHLRILLGQLILVAVGLLTMKLRRPLRLPRGAVVTLAAAVVVSLAAGEVTLREAGYRPWTPQIRKTTFQPPGPVRARHPRLGYVDLPGRFRATLPGGYTFQFTHDRHGLRITHPPRPEGGRREIWIFGGSFVHGWSLQDDETFCWLLQEALPGFEVRNFGVVGYGTLQSLLQFQESRERMPPPETVIVVYADFHNNRNTVSRLRRRHVVPRNDLGPLTMAYARISGGEIVVRTRPLVYRELPLMRHSALVALLEDAYDRLEDRIDQPLQVTRALLLEFARQAEDRGARFLLVGITDSEPTRRMLGFARRHGIPSADIAVDLHRPEYTNLPADPHPSALANRHYAEALEEFLRRECGVR